jgi:aspartyl-tRNA(Asn)/glutamyl-tRNA(Gln) amidotransferase subunit C
MRKEDIERLATLARIELKDEESIAFAEDITSILGYVSEITQITGSNDALKVVGPVFNVMRDDTEPHEAGLYTEDLLNAAPDRQGSYVKVKKILEDT